MTAPLEPVVGRNPAIVAISNSELQTFKTCKRQWWLGYYRGLTPINEKVLGPLALGTRVHKALEWYYNEGKDPVAGISELNGALRAKLALEGGDMEAFEKEAELGRIMMEGYLPWLAESGADSTLEIIGAEKKLSVPIMDGRVELQGKVDLRIRRKIDGARLFMDFKTAANAKLYTDIAHMSEQIKMYLLLERMTADEHPVDGARYRFIKKVKRTAAAKPPFYFDFDVRHNDQVIDSFWTSVHGVIHNVVSLRQQLDDGADPQLVAYPTPTNDCTWKCPFYHQCPMFDNGEPAEEMLGDLFKQHDPYERYEEAT